MEHAGAILTIFDPNRLNVPHRTRLAELMAATPESRERFSIERALVKCGLGSALMMNARPSHGLIDGLSHQQVREHHLLGAGDDS